MALISYPQGLRYSNDAELASMTEHSATASGPAPASTESVPAGDRMAAPLRPVERGWFSRFASTLPTPSPAED